MVFIPNKFSYLRGFRLYPTGIHPEQKCAHLFGTNRFHSQDVNKDWPTTGIDYDQKIRDEIATVFKYKIPEGDDALKQFVLKPNDNITIPEKKENRYDKKESLKHKLI